MKKHNDSNRRENSKKRERLGMYPSTANHKLHRIIIFKFAQRLDLNTCYHCGKIIETLSDFTIEHKVPWLNHDNPVEMYFSIDNIAFSHLSCNASAAQKYAGSVNHGELNGNRKITAADAEIVRQRAADGETARNIAQDFPISEWQVGKIIRGERWKSSCRVVRERS